MALRFMRRLPVFLTKLLVRIFAGLVAADQAPRRLLY